ncbi:phage capsid protein [Pacificimonas sp. ICDLI1SI03]
MESIDATFYTKFSSNVRMALGQHMSLLAESVAWEHGSGESQLLTGIIGQRKLTTITSRNADTPLSQGKHDRIWVFKPEYAADGEIVDNIDQLASIISLESANVQSQAAAVKRYWDDQFLQGFFGLMHTGKTGAVQKAFPAANVVPKTVGATTGLNVRKIRTGVKLLRQGFVNLQQPIYMPITAEAQDDLSQDAKAENSDFLNANKARWSADGKMLEGIAGVTFIPMELGNPMLDAAPLTWNEGTEARRLPMYTKDGMTMVDWEKEYSSIRVRPDKNDGIQAYVRSAVTASRTDQARVAIIEVTEGAGG